MDQPLFQIRNLICSYGNSSGKSLEVPELDIPKGKLVFLLGASGAGKSTLLETLGLMNDTIESGEVLFYPIAGQPPVNLNLLWDGNDKNNITSIRKNYFSFIFQNTNLMENFTAYENVCLSGMIKQNLTQENILPKAKELMNKVKLPENEVSLSTLAINLSGGQRQRLAFVRALNTSATVLFGDEPTGNLDNVNANELFEVIKDNLKNEKSAIVVSHDINLALKYADMIILISKDSNKGYGEIKNENVYHRAQWENNSETEKENFIAKIRQLFNTGDKQVTSKNKDQGKVNLKTNYRQLFYKKESNILLGKRKANFIVLSTILFFTFLAVGFANGSLDYLNKKMNSAFVNWVSITIPWSKDKVTVQKIIQLLEDPENGKKYAYQNNNITAFVKNPLTIYDFTRKQAYNISGRTVDLKKDNKLINEYVLSEKNLVKGSKNGFKYEQDISLIVTEKILKDLHYPKNADYIYWENVVIDTFLPAGRQTQKIYIPIPIRAVVKELPGRYNFIYPIFFFKAIKNDHANVFSTISNTQYLYGFIKGVAPEKINILKKHIADFTNQYQLSKFQLDSLNMIIESPLFKNDTPAINAGVQMEIDFFKNNDHRLLDTFWTKMLKSPAIAPYSNNITRTFDYGLASDVGENPDFDQISVYFTNLNNINGFADLIKSQNEKGETEGGFMEIDVTKVREKENFNFLSTVTLIISFLLIIFSSVAICLFIFNLLKMHLLKVSMNLGTFKAIGLGETEARSIYFYIILSFIFLTSVISILLAAVAGQILNIILVKNLKVEEGITYFKILDWNTLLTFCMIVFTSIFVSWITINKIISKSPGDLIYNR